MQLSASLFAISGFVFYTVLIGYLLVHRLGTDLRRASAEGAARQRLDGVTC